MRLGGKSYAPTSDHPLAPYNKELVEFADVVHKMYTQLEEAPNPGDAVKKVLAAVRSQMVRNATHMRLSSVDKVFADLGAIAAMTQKRYGQGGGGLTPQRGSMAGQLNAKAVRGLVDYLACDSSIAPKINLHVLLGKLRPADGQSPASAANKTPIAMPNVLTLFTSPEPVVQTGIEARLAKATTTSAVERTPQSSRKRTLAGLPKFHSTLSWAIDSSPLLARSTEKLELACTDGATLAVSATGETQVLPNFPTLLLLVFTIQLRVGAYDVDE